MANNLPPTDQEALDRQFGYSEPRSGKHSLPFDVKFALTLAGAREPTYAYDDDSGLDLYAPEAFTLVPFTPILIDTGVVFELPPGYEGQVRSRSSHALLGIIVGSGLATCDRGYRGSVGVSLFRPTNAGNREFPAGAKIAQYVIAPVAHARLVQVASVDEMTKTARQAAGFGSSGV